VEAIIHSAAAENGGVATFSRCMECQRHHQRRYRERVNRCQISLPMASRAMGDDFFNSPAFRPCLWAGDNAAGLPAMRAGRPERLFLRQHAPCWRCCVSNAGMFPELIIAGVASRRFDR